MNKIIDISSDLYLEIGEPSNISVPYITSWLRANIGVLNNEIDTSYTIDPSTLEILPDLTDDESAILKQIFLIRYYAKEATRALQAAVNNDIIEVREGDATIRLHNKTETAKTYVQLRKDAETKLLDQVGKYRMNKSSPQQVVGDDGIPDYYDTEALNQWPAYKRSDFFPYQF